MNGGTAREVHLLDFAKSFDSVMLDLADTLSEWLCDQQLRRHQVEKIQESFSHRHE